MDKKCYSAPVVKSENVVLGVFGTYGSAGGNKPPQNHNTNRGRRPANHRRPRLFRFFF